MMAIRYKLLITLLLLGAFLQTSIDISSFSNIDQIVQKKLAFSINVNFDKKIVEGLVRISFEAIKDGDYIILDTKNLIIKKVTDSLRGEELDFILDSKHSIESLGTPMVVNFQHAYKTGDHVEILIEFSTTNDSLATQWYDKEMTLGKEYPFMYTQGEAILIRSLIPCQDTPAAKVQVSASITVKNPLVALYSGIRTDVIENEDNTTTYIYEQKINVPTYLIAIAVGKIEGVKINSRTTVYAEKELVQKSAWEFAETERFIETAEAYLTPYEWGQYNILVLPPGFPYGGMENPTLTFVTPALIAGDRSLANVIAHEISHSWTGNLVTMKNWRSFWLNEGFTVFVERKIAQRIYGNDMRKLNAAIGYTDLLNDINTFGPKDSFTSLYPDIQQRDPDDAFSTVPYEKGFNFLYFLESITGEDKFNLILKNYISQFRRTSIEYTDWKDHYISNVKSLFDESSAQGILNQVDWDTWLFGPGLPPKINDFTNSYMTEADERVTDLLGTGSKEDFQKIFKSWHTAVKQVFFNLILSKLDKLTDTSYVYLRDTFKLNSDSFNMEVRFLWFLIGLKTKRAEAIPYVTSFLGTIGRMKYIRPLYMAFAQLNKKQAYDVFLQNKIIYHPVAIRLIENDFKNIPDTTELEFLKDNFLF